MSVIICKSLAALELGFLSYFLRVIQRSAWSKWDEDREAISPCLKQMTRLLLAVREGFDALHWSLFEQCKADIERGHEQALQVRDSLTADLTERVGEDEAFRQLPTYFHDRAADWREAQNHDWEAVTLLLLKAVEPDPQLTAWWKLGFGIASLVFRLDTDKTILAHTNNTNEGFWWEAEQFSEAERAWVRELLPTNFEATVEDTVRLLTSYHDLRAGLPEMDRLRGRSSVEGLFRHNADFSKCWWHVTGDLEFDEVERVVVKRLFENMEQRGQGVKLKDLLDGTRRAFLTRLDAVFCHGKWPHRRCNPAWSEKLIQNVYGGEYRLNLQEHKRTPKDTTLPTHQE